MMRASISKKVIAVLTVFLLLAFIAIFLLCHHRAIQRQRTAQFPPIILWAWERPENFDFIDTKETGVAFLAQSIELRNEEAIRRLRMQPLDVSKETFIIAVTRIETNKNEKPSLSKKQLEETVTAIQQTASLQGVKAVQIDFDALVSEREFYKSLLVELRKRLPENIALSMTALASWCMYDGWLSSVPVDEAVPMLFRMGVDERNIVSYLNSGNDWHIEGCRQSYGISTDEPERIIDRSRRVYFFNPRSWTKEDFQRIKDKVKR
jgi:hypothetical protein